MKSNRTPNDTAREYGIMAERGLSNFPNQNWGTVGTRSRTKFDGRRSSMKEIDDDKKLQTNNFLTANNRSPRSRANDSTAISPRYFGKLNLNGLNPKM